MSRKTVNLTREVQVVLPARPNFIYDEDGETRIALPVDVFSEVELRKIGEAWTTELILEADIKRRLKKEETK